MGDTGLELNNRIRLMWIRIRGDPLSVGNR